MNSVGRHHRHLAVTRTMIWIAIGVLGAACRPDSSRSAPNRESKAQTVPAVRSMAAPISNDDLCVIKPLLDERRKRYHETNPLLNVPDEGIRFEFFAQQVSLVEGDASLLDEDLTRSIGWLSEPDSLVRVSCQVLHSGYGNLRHAPDVCRIELAHWLADDPVAFADDLVAQATTEHDFSVIDEAVDDLDAVGPRHLIELQTDDLALQIGISTGRHQEVHVTIFTRTPKDDG